MEKSKIAIVGSGIAGLSAAIRLAHNGHSVTIYEANSYPGGKLTQFYQGNYRFDAGPSLFTMPKMVEDLIILAGLDPKIAFPYRRIENGCHYFYEDGTQFIAFQNKEKLGREIQEKFDVDPKMVFNFLEKAAFKYQIAAPLFLESSLHRFKTYFSIKTLKGLLAIPKLNLFESMHLQNQRELQHPLLVQYFNRFATYNGSNPYQAPAILNMIPHLEHGIGAFFPKHGMHQITNVLVQTAQKLGVQFRFNQKVDEIVVLKNTVEGIKIGSTIEKYDKVVSNMDILSTYRKLMPKIKAPEKLLNQEKSSSAIIFYWGIKSKFPQLDLHNIFFSNDYKGEFEAIFKEKKLFSDPTIYINISSKYLPTDSPEGCENWFVMVNVPPNTGQDWDKLIAETKINVLNKLNRLLQTNLESYIENESVLDPRSIEKNTSSFGGSLYGNASNNRFAAFLRHPNFTKKIKGLYVCGGSVHPGGGIPLCLNSGKIVAEMIGK